MTKNKLIAALAKKSNMTREQTSNMLLSLTEIIEEQLIAGEKVQITGFGTFEVKERGERNGRNPYTGESIVIAPSKRPVFVAGKSLKDKIK